MENDTLMLRNIPPRLKGKIVRRVEQTGTSMTNIALEILCDEFGIQFKPTGRWVGRKAAAAT